MACACTRKIANIVDNAIFSTFHKIGHFAVRFPLLFVVLPVVLAVGLGAGLIISEAETDPSKLFTPTDSRAATDREFVEKYYGRDSTILSIYAVSASTSDTNILMKPALQELLTVYNAVSDFETNGYIDPTETLAFQDRCMKAQNDCLVSSVLDYWGYSSSNIDSDANIIQTVNNQAARDKFGRIIATGVVMSGLQRTNGQITTAEAFQIQIIMKNEENEDNPIRDLDTMEWEIGLEDHLLGLGLQQLEIFVLGDGIESEAQSGALTGDISNLTIGYMLMLVYASFVLATRSWYTSQTLLATLSILSAGMALISSYGFGSICGVQMNVVVNTLALLILGLSVDDTFIIMDSIRGLEPEINDLSILIPQALARAGSSILVTSATDVVAFLAGSFTQLPALKAFCLFAALGVMFDFLYQVTFFMGCAVWALRRERDQRYDVLCCVKRKPELCCCFMCCSGVGATTVDDPTTVKKVLFGDGLMKTVVGVWLPNVILTLPGKIFTLIFATIVFVVGVIGVSQLSQDFSAEWFTPSDHALQDTYQVRDKYFRGTELPMGLFVGEIDYADHDVQVEIVRLKTALAASDWITKGSVDLWYDHFIRWLEDTRPVELVNGKPPKEKFIPWLNDYIDGAGGRFDTTVILSDDKTTIRSSVITARIIGTALQSGSGAIKALDAMYAVSAPFEPTLKCFPYSFPFQFWEGYKVITEETVRNILVAAAAVFIVTLVLLGDIWQSLLVLLMIGMIDCNMLGYLYWLGLTFNSVTTINIVLAIGLSVDYAVHIAHTFLHVHGTRTERSRAALYQIGPSVANGGVSTFVAVVMLAGSSSFVFQVFFKMFTLIIVFGLFHGLCVLPVLMSFIGPPAHDEPNGLNKGENNDTVNHSKVAPAPSNSTDTTTTQNDTISNPLKDTTGGSQQQTATQDQNVDIDANSEV